MSTFSNEQLAGAIWILKEALQTKPGNAVLVVHDEGTESTAKCLHAVPLAHSYPIRLIKVPISDQERYTPTREDQLPDELRDAIRTAGRVILLQTPIPSVSFFRFQLLRFIEQAGANRITASMPGITLEHLSCCTGDLNAIERDCELVAHRLVWTWQARLLTTGLDGQDYSLDIPLGDYLPIASPGRIHRGWGNVPSGETFIVPNPYQASGTVAINGSALLYPIPDDQELVLTFHAGRVVSPLRGGVPEHVKKLIFDDLARPTTVNSDALAELGIGVNPHISKFTGLPILDEKIRGTVHLGLGGNTQFDGPIACETHHDFVIRNCTLELDHTLCTKAGRLVLSQEDVFPDYSTVPIRYLDAHRPITTTGVAMADKTNTGKMLAFREWTTKRNRYLHRMETPIGNAAAAALAYRLLSVVEDSPTHQVAPRELRFIPDLGVPIDAIEPVLEILLRFRLIKHV